MNERSIFMAALELTDPLQREAHLHLACGGDERLQNRIEALLHSHKLADAFLLDRTPGLDLAATCDRDATLEGPGTTIGPYKLLEQIGEGGMGVVYVAEQSQPVRRRVALKVIKPGMDTRQVIARFEAERQALALMDHPNIAKVHDAGATPSGRPYFVMELVKGIPVTDYCDQARLSVRDRLDLFVLVCRAVQHAHQKGIIHRDLKPSNILVTLIDGVAVPKVIDFGIAKTTGAHLTEKSIYTGFAQLVGTPLYMSPEQAELSGVDVDTRSDIYALGVLLYELLTGTTPIDRETLCKAAYDEIRRVIRDQEPPTPSTRLGALGVTLSAVSANRQSDARKLGNAVRGELDWIVMKALEKDRNRRYETANDFAADVMRHLTDQPVEACPPSAWYRLRKSARRYRVALTTAAIVSIALVVGATASAWQAFRATGAERRALLQSTLARQAVDEMYVEVAERRMTHVLGTEPTPAQKSFLAKSLAFYEIFADDPSRETEARHRALHASVRVGEIQLKLARPARAERAFRRALALAGELSGRAEDPRELLRDQADAHRRLGAALLARKRTAEAEATLRAGLALQESVVALTPAPADRLTLAGLLLQLADLEYRSGQPDEAEAHADRGLSTLEGLAAGRADESAYSGKLADCIGILTGFQYPADRGGPGAHRRLAQLNRCIQLAESALATRPEDVGLRDALTQLLMEMALIQDDLESEPALRQLMRHYESLAADFPSMPAYRYGLAHTQRILAIVLEGSGRAVEARKLGDQALTTLGRLIADFPDEPEYRETLKEVAADRAVEPAQIERGDFSPLSELKGTTNTLGPPNDTPK